MLQIFTDENELDSVVRGRPVDDHFVEHLATYVGELGYELHVPMEGIGGVFDTLMAAGAAYDIAPVGYRALESQFARIESISTGADLWFPLMGMKVED